ncbi:phage recombination protein Bet [Clostridium perfringens]|uniref:phage recombination protein Bet n=1 Tax=Clostridium perfringens TaxID=1502 RepID=UPI00244A8D46|nr:phage recombination protein Bet [Clostridium perfringens]MDH2459467.1 phage recombination protein Bet [Clostridium perfringens]
MAENKQLEKKEEKKYTYMVAGEEVTLTPSIVQQFIARGNKTLTTREIGNFIQLCKYRKLNPFLNEAYPVKFGNDGAQLIVGFEAFKRKAEENPNYRGHRAGVIVVRDKEVLELEGSFKLPTDQLVGGWAEVAVEGKNYPIVAKVSFQEYNKNQSTWKAIPCTMIRKVALSQALREAFPGDLGALYSGEELGVDANSKIINVETEVKEEIKENANSIPLDLNEDVPVTKTITDEVKEVEFVEAEVVENEDENPPF